MENCPHTNLMVLGDQQRQKLRCRHCHLTIDADELSDEFCPECFEATGYKRFDFEEVESERSADVRYRCEDCGVFIEVENSGT